VRDHLESLVDDGFVAADDDLAIEPTALGRLASKYYLRLDTARRFRRLADRETLTVDSVLETVASAGEFDSVSARSAESDAIDRILDGRDTDLEDGHRKVFAILIAGMADSIPSDLRSDAWVIRQNALRLLAALAEFLDRFAGPRAANLARRVEARVEHGVSREAVALTAIEGVGSGRAERLADAGLTSPADVVDAGATELENAGMSDSVAERIVDAARDCPRIDVDWGDFPGAIAVGENEMCEVSVEAVSGSARAGIRVTVNDVEMTATTTYLDGEATVPVGVFGPPDADELEFVVEVVFPDLPLLPVTATRTVRVE
jgi:replicative superfamily II helicase